MLSLRPLDERVPIQQQLGAEASPAILINVFTVAPEDVDGLLAAWEHGATWMKKQPGYISTQLHRGIAGSELCHLGIGRAFPRGFHQSRVSRRARRLSVERRHLAASVREGGGAEFMCELGRPAWRSIFFALLFEMTKAVLNLRSFPRKRESSRMSHVTVSRWVPAFAGTSGSKRHP